MTNARLAHISVYPVKALDAATPDRVEVTPGGGLAGDRAYALYDDEGYINGRRTPAIHEVTAAFQGGEAVRLSAPGQPTETFDLGSAAAIEEWFGEYLGRAVELRGGRSGGQSDRAIYGDGSQTGPTLVSAATLRELASWYDGIDAEGMRRRLRPNLVVEGVEAFWEERLLDSLRAAVYVDAEATEESRESGFPRVRIGDVVLEGVEPIPRCAVPTRDPDTGVAYDGFRETFIEGRRETLPPWVDEATLAGNLYTATVGMRIPKDGRDGDLVVGAPVEVLGSR